jgi:glycylpeptide N-tetradecanoyltransferase
MSSQNAKGKQVTDAVDDDNELSLDESGGSEPEEPTNEPDAQMSSSKKKKKKKSKLAKLLNPAGAAEDKLVETVLEKVKAEHADADEDTVRAALQQLNLKDVIAGKSGLGGKNQKDTGGHKVRDNRVSFCQVCR